jgi:3-deoxy-manno-octulosonate cytidylyltransferase (CMP-KDO synthetase)
VLCGFAASLATRISAANLLPFAASRVRPTARFMSQTIIIIPARLAATRLPGKPLAEIGGEAMIVHVWRRACTSGLGPVLVAADCAQIAEAVSSAGGRCVLTRPDHLSGSDRILEALASFDPGRQFDIILNLQADLPMIDPAYLAKVLSPLATAETEIATLAAPIASREELSDPNVVKVGGAQLSSGHIRARYFGRAATGEGPLYHHVGLYAYRRAALERFATLPPSAFERREGLEQLRALENGMRIDVALVDKPAFSVDTAADLERARAILRQR